MWADLLNPSAEILSAVINNEGLDGSSEAVPGGPLLPHDVRVPITSGDTMHNVSQKPQSIIDA